MPPWKTQALTFSASRSRAERPPLQRRDNCRHSAKWKNCGPCLLPSALSPRLSRPCLSAGCGPPGRHQLRPWAMGPLDLNLTLHFQKGTLRPGRGNDLSKVQQPCTVAAVPLVPWYHVGTENHSREKRGAQIGLCQSVKWGMGQVGRDEQRGRHGTTGRATEKRNLRAPGSAR